MTGPRKRNRDMYADVGTIEADQEQRAMRHLTGLDLMPRGETLAEYVAAQMQAPRTAASIARSVGYTVDRCAALLASARHAPLARALLNRDAMDEMFREPILPPPPQPEPEPRTTRPGPTADELLWEIEDAHARGDLLEDVAAMFGVDQLTLRRWVRRRGIVAEVEAYYPRRVSGVRQVVS